MSKSPKKVMLTPAEKAINQAKLSTKKPSVAKSTTSTINAVNQSTISTVNNTHLTTKSLNAVDPDSIPRQRFHNKGKNRKPKQTSKY